MVSNIGDNWQRGFPEQWPFVPKQPTFQIPEISRSEFDALKREVEALRKLLAEAKKFDEATGQPDCEMDAKVKFIKQIAEAVGVSMDDIFKS